MEMKRLSGIALGVVCCLTAIGTEAYAARMKPLHISEDGHSLVERGGTPKGKALPGGFAKYGKSYEQSAREEVKEETNLDVEIVRLLGVYSDPARDPRKHVTSTVYVAGGSGELKFGDDAAGVGLFDPRNPPELVFDHNRIVEDYLKTK